MNSNIITLKFCPNCAIKGCIDDKFLKYHIKGYKATYDSNDITKCLECGDDLIDCNISCDDYITILHVSIDSELLKSMIELHTKDPIEYTLKMSKFKTQIEQQKAVIYQSESKVFCPYCHSTNIHKISGTERITSIVGLGIFSKKINKSFKCNNCSGTF